MNINQIESNSGKEPLSIMKQWIFSKFSNVNGDTEDNADDKTLGSVPKIVISKGSEKSLNTITSTPPPANRPSPLTKTWSNFSESKWKAPASVPHNVNRTFWHSSHSRNNSQRRLSNSVPSTPMSSANTSKHKRFVHSADGHLSKSPVFRFSQKYILPLTDATSVSGASHTSCGGQLDSHSLCGTCGQQIQYYDSRESVGLETQQHLSATERHKNIASIGRPLRNSHLGLRRTSSCTVENDRHTARDGRARIMKASSHIDVQRQRPMMSKAKRIKSTGSKEKSRSTISLTRSWSIKLDSIRIVRNDSAKSYTNDYSRKMSLNDNELRHGNDRRRSSLLRLFCIDNDKRGDMEERESMDSGMRHSVEDYLDFSPKVTRSDKFVNGDPVDSFRSTFESDSIRIPSIYGQVKVMFQFFNDNDELHVTLLKGSNVARGQSERLGIYTKVCLMPGKVQNKVGDDKHDTHDPVFYESFVFKMTLGELLDRQLRVKLYNKPGIFSLSQPIGEFLLPLYPFDLTAVTVIWQNLKRCKGQKDELDEFDFSPIEKDHVDVHGVKRYLCGLGRPH